MESYSSEPDESRSGELTTRRVYRDIEEIVDDVQIRFERFKNFDRISDVPWDHRFVSTKFSFRQIPPGSGSRKGIEKEWDNLEKTLHNSPIFVRTYGSRTDLMRAVVIGPPDTPYQHGLFFFDIYLPSKYPASPPKIYYCSSKLESNYPASPPNFDVWFERLIRRKEGEGYSISDILFAIHKNFLSCMISGQSSIPHRDMFGCFPRSSRPSNSDQMQRNTLEPQKYDKLAFLNTCKRMIVDLRDPPHGFQEFVPGHYREKSHLILWKVKNNIDNGDDMLVMFERLYMTFEANGSYVNHFSGFLEEKKLEKRSSDSEQDEIMNSGFMSKLKKGFVDLLD